MIFGLDPGPVHSALVGWDGQAITFAQYDANEVILKLLIADRHCPDEMRRPLVIEQVASYGMPVGAEVFETVFWSGRFAEAYGMERVERMPRMMVKMHLCHSSRAKDGNIRQALIDRYGPCGTKKQPGRLYGMAGDLWAALAVAVTAYDRRNGA